MSCGQRNRTLGWILLVVGFAWAAWLDPWALQERNPVALIVSARLAVRQAQAVVLAMAFLQLAVGQVLSEESSRLGESVSWLTGIGALLYALGYALVILWPVSAWLIPTGALMNATGCVLLVRIYASGAPSRTYVGAPFGRQEAALRQAALAVIAFGMALDAVMGLFAVNPALFQPPILGPEDGVRLRMLRLARVAAIALPVLVLLYQDLVARAQGRGNAVRWGQMGMLCGTIGMAAVLTLAAFTTVTIKYLLPIPALSIYMGTLAGARLARQHARPLERWGWMLLAVSMAIGLLMGLYAFEGPLPSPAFLGAYNDFPRRLARLGHAYCIVLGLLSIFVAREQNHAQNHEQKKATAAVRLASIGTALLVTGAVLTLVLILSVAVIGLPTGWLSLGPALTALAIGLCVRPLFWRPGEK